VRAAAAVVALVVVRPGLVPRVQGGGEETRRLGFVGDTGWRRDDEELGRDEVEFDREGEEARIERGLCFGLFEDLAVMEVGVSKDASEAAGKRAKMPMRGRGDVNPAEGAGKVKTSGKGSEYHTGMGRLVASLEVLLRCPRCAKCSLWRSIAAMTVRE